MTGPSVFFRQLSVTANGHSLLKPLDLSLSGGQWHAIAGPNGGGKSTLLKALCGQHHHQGCIAIDWSGSDRQEIGYVPQLAPFDASLPVTARDFLMLNSQRRPIWQRYKSDPDIERVVERLHIMSLLDKRLGTLSTGERQRVLLAAALLKSPTLLLLDEPIAGVDQAGKQLMLTILERFHQQGGTTIMVEHDPSVIKQKCDTVTIINGGLVRHHTPETDIQMQPVTSAMWEGAVPC